MMEGLTSMVQMFNKFTFNEVISIHMAFNKRPHFLALALALATFPQLVPLQLNTLKGSA